MNKMFEKRKKTNPSAGRRKIAIEPLEERILLSVDLIPYAPDDRDEDKVFYEWQVEPVQPEVEQTAQSVVEQAARELVILDSTLGDLSPLQAALTDIGFGGADNKTVAIVGSKDEAIAALSTGVRYDAIHWISHGSADGFQIGEELLSADVGADDPLISVLARSMGPDSDLMFYACDLADGGLPQRLAVLTGAGVAASTDTTGSEGDWELEAQYGAIETQALNLGDAIAALGTATKLDEYLAAAQTPTETVADLFGAGGLYAGATFPTSTAWRDLADTDTDPLSWFGDASTALNEIVGIVEEATLTAGRAALAAEVDLLPTAVRSALFDETGLTGPYNASDTSHLNGIMAVIAAGDYLAATTVNASNILTTAQVNRLVAAYNAGAETINFTTLAGADATDLVSNIKSSLANFDQANFADRHEIAAKRIVSLFSKIAAELILASPDEAASNKVVLELDLSGNWQGLPRSLTNGFGKAQGTIALTKEISASGVDLTQVAELELRAVTDVSATIVDGTTTDIDLTNIPNVAVPAFVTLGSETFDVLLDATASTLAEALEANTAFAAKVPVGLTVTVSGNTLSVANSSGADVAFQIILNKTGVRSATMAASGSETVTFEDRSAAALPVRFQFGTKVFDVVLDTTASTVAGALAANGDFVAQAAAANLTVSVSDNSITFTNSGTEEASFSFNVREEATLYDGAIGTGFFARDPQVDLARTKLFVRAAGGEADSFLTDSSWIMAMPLDFGDSIMGAQFSNTYTFGGAGLGAPSIAIDTEQLYGSNVPSVNKVYAQLNPSGTETPVKTWLDGLTSKVSLDHPVDRDAFALLGLQRVVEDMRVIKAPITKDVVTPASDKVQTDALQIPVLRDGEAFVDTPDAGFGDLLGISATSGDTRTLAERQVADLTSLPELAGIGSQDGELAAILEGLSDAIARTWSDRTENSATAVSAALASVSTDFALVGLNAYSAANLLDGAGASAFNLSYDADVLNVDLTGLLVREEAGVRAVWGEIPLLKKIGERTADMSLGATVKFNSTYNSRPADLNVDIAANVVSVDTSNAALDINLPGEPRIDMASLTLGLSQGFVIGTNGWNLDDTDTDDVVTLSFDLDFNDPRGEFNTWAESVLDNTYSLSIATFNELRIVNTGYTGLFDDATVQEALYWLKMREADTIMQEGFLAGLLAMPELKGLIPVVGSSIADIIVNNDATTATQADFQNYLVNALQTQFGSFDETTDLSSLMTSLTGASNYTANFNSTDGVTLDFAGSALTLPQILIDFSRLSTLLLSGAVYGVTPTAAARVRTRIQAVNSVVASYNGGALVEETLTFDTWFEPLETAGSTDNMFEFDLGFSGTGVGGTTLQIDLGKLGKQDITNPTFGLKVAFRPETLSTNGRLPGGESPRLSPLASDNEGQHDISGSVTQGDQFRVTFTSNVTWATSADIGQIYVDANGDQFRLTAIAGDQSTADFLPLDGTTAPVGGLTDAVAFYEFILPIDYADQAVGTTFAPRFVASGFDQIVADDPRLLLVNDSEWEMKLLLDEAAQRFSDTWLKRDGALSQLTNCCSKVLRLRMA